MLNLDVTAKHTAEMMNRSKQRIENSEYPEIITLDPKYEWKKDKEIKMTREEAIQKVCGVTSNVNRYDIVNILEALGLIKFDEEEISLQEVIVQARYFSNTTQEFINRLDIGGYKIVKK